MLLHTSKKCCTFAGGSRIQPQLLQEIEELTLYILQQEEKIKQQEARIKVLETR